MDDDGDTPNNSVGQNGGEGVVNSAHELSDERARDEETADGDREGCSQPVDERARAELVQGHVNVLLANSRNDKQSWDGQAESDEALNTNDQHSVVVELLHKLLLDNGSERADEFSSKNQSDSNESVSNTL